MNTVERDIYTAQEIAAEMFADEAFQELYETAEDKQGRAEWILFYLIQKMRETEQ
ncbi:hypothetical protein [Ruegeria sp. ANG-S4]|uniref:hypothetical protein n=1 Tax=Ruegeria sp. ANG-S4 TaxID=1577904 RepID=UPI000B0AF38C|nr:hypothetical protein [Ruegeria sp. ANG-S4]